MYTILKDGELMGFCDKPHYVRIKEESSSWIEATEKDAEAIAINGILYNLVGKNTIADAPKVVVKSTDTAEYIFSNRTKIAENNEAHDVAIAALEVAACEQESASEDRISAIEEAICALDAAINGGE